jgi:hypothetical protein
MRLVVVRTGRPEAATRAKGLGRMAHSLLSRSSSRGVVAKVGWCAVEKRERPRSCRNPAVVSQPCCRTTTIDAASGNELLARGPLSDYGIPRLEMP